MQQADLLPFAPCQTSPSPEEHLPLAQIQGAEDAQCCFGWANKAQNHPVKRQRISKNTYFPFLFADIRCETNAFTHCLSPFLGAGPLVSRLDGHSVACSRGIQRGSELSWRAEVQWGFRRGRFGGHRGEWM